MGLDQPPADGKAEPRPDGPCPGLAARPGGILAEQLRQALGRDPPALVGNRDRDMDPVALGREPDRRGLRRACRAAFASRLLSTCSTRWRSAMTRGRSGGRSISTVWRPPPERKVVRARSTSAATSEGSGETESVPVSMRPASSSSETRPIMRSACPSTMRMNSRVSAGANCRDAPSRAAVEPLMEVSGIRSSWLTMARNSARWRSSS